MNRLMNFYPQGGMKGVLSLQIENQQIQPLLEKINSTEAEADQRSPRCAVRVMSPKRKSETDQPAKQNCENSTAKTFAQHDKMSAKNEQNSLVAVLARKCAAAHVAIIISFSADLESFCTCYLVANFADYLTMLDYLFR